MGSKALHPVPGAIDDYRLIKKSLESRMACEINSFHFLSVIGTFYCHSILLESKYFTIGTFARENKNIIN